ncbi:hypothetical protein PHYBLDRAFT_70590 [Phycomyces blakesleeanus NRRL 1555(-)]|uniref:Uncharacterized protein n=1 Tax=Phycomyces blakesleeanus (strain ATCC 8743b / DSM 1359 / FGSC 10004 / NBRC 33097 / NRRL 1555) TaxID=763407 RepID=A0A167LHQ5_PHYB8|nr:hypothetical protein PHYBLDRAFT_70590 [Phycomyces blakesleeanus NRRL 1555(-)]OAD70487.1 hypothetical protein PHYBLDRAFT_70590 [Phycomyces blakesleeanus NRRL 1555(-)]|eukprot:XP_018288527.1 hypothetical protein PHYBLDRAFT_70590 [Phycomyces blakesleeanus NRRL 1555(-)]
MKSINLHSYSFVKIAGDCPHIIENSGNQSVGQMFIILEPLISQIMCAHVCFHVDEISSDISLSFGLFHVSPKAVTKAEKSNLIVRNLGIGTIFMGTLIKRIVHMNFDIYERKHINQGSLGGFTSLFSILIIIGWCLNYRYIQQSSIQSW